MAIKKFNKTDDPIQDIAELSKEVDWDTYEHKDKFTYLCKVTADRKQEKIIITDQVAADMARSCVYIMVINGKIFKIGTALRGIRARIRSYNTGKMKYRARGTNSSTNFWVLQSFINLEEEVTIYALYPKTQTIEVFGEKIEEPMPSAKTMEGVIIRLFENEYKTKPIGITQK